MFVAFTLDSAYHRNSPDSFDLSGKNELVLFALTFLTSTWYIKNPFLKSKINEVSHLLSSFSQHISQHILQTLFYGILRYNREPYGILGHVLNTHPMALKHLMPALMHFYIGQS
jgi:ubiquitin conjugation factor E4 B